MSILNLLNPEQRKAAEAINGQVLILAGAGSGKTRTITHRIAYMIKEKNIDPSSILAVTFTNKAAKEMLGRAMKLINGTVSTTPSYPFFPKNKPVFGTFHSICAKILRLECNKIGYKQNFAIYDADDQKKLIKTILKDLNLDEKKNNPLTILSMISRAKNELKDPNQFEKLVKSPISEIASKVYPVYQETLKKNNAFDFDDLLLKTVELFKKDEKTLNYYNDLWKYVHVDEYQDTNYVQYVLVKLLTQKHQNLCVVGDPDQSIYAWRGADIRNILNFEKDYKDITIIKLEQNYRSTKKILKASQAVISKNTSRKEKTLWTENETGKNIQIISAENGRMEGDKIIHNIHRIQRINDNCDLNDFVILFRVNAQSRSLEESCLRYAIPYVIIGGVKFYERKEIKDVLGYLRVIYNPDDDLSMQRIINVPARSIGQTTLNKLLKIGVSRKQSISLVIDDKSTIDQFAPKTKKSLENFSNLLRILRESNKRVNVSTLISEVMDKSGYKNFLNDGTEENKSRLENINELLSVAQKYDYLEPEIGLQYFLEEISLLTDADRKLTNEKKLTLMTMHSAKGLEYKYVFIAGAEENLFPHSRSQFDAEQLEEERRLAYVCMTRAKKELYLFHAKKRMMYGTFQINSPSRFLYDIPKEICDGFKKTDLVEDYTLNTEDSQLTYYSEKKPVKPAGFIEEEEEVEVDTSLLKDGVKISHPSFGKGVILNRNGDIAEIAFETIGIKKIALSIAPLRIL